VNFDLGERLARLGPREQRILNAGMIGLAVLVLFLLPIGLTALEHSRRSENEALRDAADLLSDNRDAVEHAKAEKAATLQRYAKPAPPLAAFLAGLASESGVEIPESQDRQAVPHGKKYSERSTKLVLHKVGMLKLSKFMERIEQSDYPIDISTLNIRKRGPEPDSYDVEMVVSAFDRTNAPEKAAKKPGTDSDSDEAKP
jgi:general secretion pathway protein M